MDRQPIKTETLELVLPDSVPLRLEFPKPPLWERIRWWWRGRKRMDCDGCDGTFRLKMMCPTSGDCWLCPDCTDKMLDELERGRKADGAMGEMGITPPADASPETRPSARPSRWRPQG